MDTTELLSETEFWNIIDETLKKSKGNYENQQDALKEILLQRQPLDILKFENRFRQLSDLTYTHELWAAAYIINGGCSDGAFDDFRGWLIAKGKEKFYKIIEQPENLIEIDFVTFEDDFEGFSFIPRLAYEELTGQEMPDGATFAMELKGKEWNAENDDLENLYPKLYAKYE